MKPSEAPTSAGPAGQDGRALRYVDRRRELLDAATEVLLSSGLRQFSLRAVAAAIGVTHASLLRHFSSKDDLLLAVLQNIRHHVAEDVAVAASSGQRSSAAEVLRAVWRGLSEPRHQRQFLLLFEMVDRRQVDSGAPVVASALVDDWIDLISGFLRADGWNSDDATSYATLLLAQIRGLQLDLLVTGARDRVDRAFEVSLTGLPTSTSEP